MVVIRKEGYIIQFNNISKNFSREKLKLLTLRLSVTMKHLTIILLVGEHFKCFLGGQ